MTSLDIVSLYPCIDTREVTNTIKNLINADPAFPKDIKYTLNLGLNLIINSNVFVLNNKFYKQVNGAPMGYLASILKLFPLDDTTMETIKPDPECWFRYVDDIYRGRSM